MSDFAIGGELSQIQNGQERTIAYASAVLSAEQRRYCTRKELLPVVKFTRQFLHYQLGRKFTVPDHHSLTWLVNFRHPEGQIARWLEELSQYDMAIVHRPGRNHVNADALSRDVVQPCKPLDKSVCLKVLPCGGCRYCRRAHVRWQDFNEEVVDIISLTSLLAEKGEQPAASSGQECDVELNSAVRQLLASGPLDDNDLDLGLPGGQLPRVSLAVIRDESVKPQYKIDYLTVRQLSGDSNGPAAAGCDASGISLSSNSAKEIAKKRRNEPVFHCLINFLSSGDAPSESELFLMGPEAKCYLLERG